MHPPPERSRENKNLKKKKLKNLKKNFLEQNPLREGLFLPKNPPRGDFSCWECGSWGGSWVGWGPSCHPLKGHTGNLSGNCTWNPAGKSQGITWNQAGSCTRNLTWNGE